MEDFVRGEAVEGDLNRLIERRVASVGEDRPGQERQNALEAMWAESDRRFQVRRRLELIGEWYAYHLRLSEAFRERAAVHEAKAQAFLEASNEGDAV